MSNQLPGIVIAWVLMAFFSFVAAAWIGIGTWTQQDQLQADINDFQSLQNEMTKESMPARFRVLDLENIGEDWSQRVLSLNLSAALDSVEVEQSSPIDGSDLIEHLVVVKIKNVALNELQQLLNGNFGAAEIAEISVATPKLPKKAGVELWDVRLALTQICLGS